MDTLNQQMPQGMVLPEEQWEMKQRKMIHQVFSVTDVFTNKNSRIVKFKIINNNSIEYKLLRLYRISEGWQIIKEELLNQSVSCKELLLELTYRDDKDPDIFDLMFHVDVMGSDKYVLEIHCNDDSINTWIRLEIQKNNGK